MNIIKRSIKSKHLCHTGYKLIRIDYTNVYAHISKAFEINNPIYYSDPELYKWLIEGTINIEMMRKEAIVFWDRFIKRNKVKV